MMKLGTMSAVLSGAAMLIWWGGTARADTPLDVTYTFSAIPGSPNNQTTPATNADWTTDPYPEDVPAATGVMLSAFSLLNPNTRLGQSQQTPGAFTYGRSIGQTFVVTISPNPGWKITLTDIIFDSVWTENDEGGAGFPNYGPGQNRQDFPPSYVGFQVGARVGLPLPDLTGQTNFNDSLIGTGLGGAFDISISTQKSHRAWSDGKNPPKLRSSLLPSGTPADPFSAPDPEHPADTFHISFGCTGNLTVHLTDPLFANINQPITFTIRKPYGDTAAIGDYTGTGLYPPVGIDNFRIQGSVTPPITGLLLLVQ